MKFINQYCPIKIKGCNTDTYRYINQSCLCPKGWIANNLHPCLPNRQAFGSREIKLLAINPKGRHIILKPLRPFIYKDSSLNQIF